MHSRYNYQKYPYKEIKAGFIFTYFHSTYLISLVTVVKASQSGCVAARGQHQATAELARKPTKSSVSALQAMLRIWEPKINLGLLPLNETIWSEHQWITNDQTHQV